MTTLKGDNMFKGLLNREPSWAEVTDDTEAETKEESTEDPELAEVLGGPEVFHINNSHAVYSKVETTYAPVPVDTVALKQWCVQEAHDLQVCDDRFGYAKKLYEWLMTDVADVVEFDVRRPRKTAGK